MHLKTLTIRRRESYEQNGGNLCAEAEFEGPGGAMKLDLAPGFIVRVLSLIEEDAGERAKRLAYSVQSAMIDVIDTARLIESDKPLQLAVDNPF